MSEPQSEAAALGLRITNLEELLMHLERTVGELNDVVLRQQHELAELREHVRRLTVTWEAAARDAPQERPPDEEKPPHY